MNSEMMLEAVSWQSSPQTEFTWCARLNVRYIFSFQGNFLFRELSSHNRQEVLRPILDL